MSNAVDVAIGVTAMLVFLKTKSHIRYRVTRTLGRDNGNIWMEIKNSTMENDSKTEYENKTKIATR